MTDIDKTYTFILKIYLATMENPLFVKLRKKETERFKSTLSLFGKNKASAAFFVCDTIGGKCVGINISHIQAANILWEPTTSYEDLMHYDGPIKLHLKGREEVIESYTESPDELLVFYTAIETGQKITGVFADFTDMDGEELLINTNELLYIEAPSSLTDEGWKIIKGKDDMDAQHKIG